MEHGRVAVIGGGVAGLVAARRLDALGFEVTLFEAGDRPGGQIRTELVAGLPVDVGAEALHLAGPHLPALLDELDLTDEVVDARPGSALVWDGRRLRRLPAGVGPTGPTRLRPVLSSGLLSARGLARAALEPFVPRGPGASDRAVGELIERRFGAEVVDRIVDPLLGNIHGGDVRRLSLQAVAPQLAARATAHRSIVLSRVGRRSGGAPSFRSFTGGLATLTDALLAGSGVAVRLQTPISGIVPLNGRYGLAGAEGETWDGIVLATPAAATARILGTVLPLAASEIAHTATASVATVIVVFPRAAAAGMRAGDATGVLVPSHAGRLLKAATFLSRKWPHLDQEDPFLVRLAAGRAGDGVLEAYDDDALVGGLLSDLGDATGLVAEPLAARVQRWPGALAQLEVGHMERIEAVRRALARLHGVALAGAAFDGLGIVACSASGERAAVEVARQLGDVGAGDRVR